MNTVFERRRPATPEETAQLIASFDATGLPQLEDAQVSEIATLAELGAMHTVLAVPNPRPGVDSFYRVAELAPSWAVGGGSAHDQDSYRRALARVADPDYEPELLFAPTDLTSSGWWMIDAIHRAAALYNTAAAGATTLRLRVFVLPRPLR
jgi:hypothetical protein